MKYQIFIGVLDSYAHIVYDIQGHICREYDKQECIIIPREQFGDLELIIRDRNGKEIKVNTERAREVK